MVQNVSVQNLTNHFLALQFVGASYVCVPVPAVTGGVTDVICPPWLRGASRAPKMS